MNMRIVFGVLVIVIAVILFPMLLTGSNTILNAPASNTEVFAPEDDGMPKEAGVTTANLTLEYYLHEGNKTKATATSSNATETATVSSWEDSTMTLRITGLEATGNRTLTITYSYYQTEPYSGFREVLVVTPTLFFVSMLLGGGYLGYTGIKQSRSFKAKKR